METMTLKAEPRSAVGTRLSRAMRAEGQLPAIIYGHGETPEAVSLNFHALTVALAHGARTLELDLGGKTLPYLIKAVQYDHLDRTPIHLDLTRVSRDERVTVRVGIELKGVPMGAHSGGILDQLMADIEVECLVTQIPETFRPFVTELELGESLFVKDLTIPEGVVLLADADDRVATVRAMGVDLEEEESAESEESTDEAEPERIGRVRKDDEAEGDAKK